MQRDRGRDRLDLRVVYTPSSVTVIVSGELDFSSVDDFRSVVLSWLSDGSQPVVVVLDQVTFIDSRGLGALVAAYRRAGEVGGTFAISSPSPQVIRALRITSLDRVFPLAVPPPEDDSRPDP